MCVPAATAFVTVYACDCNNRFNIDLIHLTWQLIILTSFCRRWHLLPENTKEASQKIMSRHLKSEPPEALCPRIARCLSWFCPSVCPLVALSRRLCQSVCRALIEVLLVVETPGNTVLDGVLIPPRFGATFARLLWPLVLITVWWMQTS